MRPMAMVVPILVPSFSSVRILCISTQRLVSSKSSSLCRLPTGIWHTTRGEEHVMCKGVLLERMVADLAVV